LEGGVVGGVYTKREELDGLGGCTDKRTFSGLMSRWKNPWAWICCSAAHTCHLTLLAGWDGTQGVQYDLDASGFEGFVLSRFEELIEINLH
jgi:hypothetical protein